MLQYIIIILSAVFSSVISELIHKYEGDKCQWGEATGTCVNIYKCPRGLLYLKSKNHPPICGFTKTNEPIICCTDCDFVEDNRKTMINPDLGILHLTGQKSHDKCVKFIDELDYKCKRKTSLDINVTSLDPVDKCRPTSPRERDFYASSKTHTFLAILGYGADMEMVEWRCAGTIISEKFILTAAECLNSDIGPVNFVAVNITDDVIAPWQKYKVKRLIPHPEFQPGSKYNDIALIETENAIAFSRDVLPACLQTNSSLDKDLAQLLVWEPIGDEISVPSKVTSTGFDEIKCSYFYPPSENLTNGFNDTIQICYGNVAPPPDSCLSDIGSPLVFYFHLLEDCADVVLGVMSIQRVCDTSQSSGLYTKVIHYLPWIEGIVWP